MVIKDYCIKCFQEAYKIDGTGSDEFCKWCPCYKECTTAEPTEEIKKRIREAYKLDETY